MTAVINGFKGKTLVSLGKKTWTAGGKESWPVPQDIVAKEFIVVIGGDIAATFTGAGASTKPAVNQHGLSHGLIAEMSLSRKGTDRVREYNGTRFLDNTISRVFGQKDGAIYKQNSTDLSGTVAQGLVEFPATSAQNVAFEEYLTMMMENKLSGKWFPTLFNTKGLQTATINMKFGQLADVKDPEDASTATYGTNGIEIEVFASCCDYLLDSPDLNQADWVQTFEELEFGGRQNKNKHRITPQGMLQGMLITGLHSSGKPFDYKNMKNTLLEIKYMGIVLYEGSMLDLLHVDCVKTHLSSRKKGQAYVSFLNNDLFDSGLFIADGKQLELIITTDEDLSYSPDPVVLRFEYDQIIFAPVAPKSVAG